MDTTQYEKAARAAIRALYGTPEGEYGPTLFVSHHLSELDADAWIKACQTKAPEAAEVLDSLVLIGSWSSTGDDRTDVFDFSLPNSVTNYLLSVRFVDGEVAEVTMES
ncbi:DUF2004 domain-containing protein [Hoeflea sp. CAU 1731]